ncbi:Histone deacetylase 2 [Nymphaea thermarum]|nr:Histone deacetylase 2 [Nymphaea thermarum]
MAMANHSSSSSSSSSRVESLRSERIHSSKLYFDVPPTKVPIIYSKSYRISLLGLERMHLFDCCKGARICRFLIEEGILSKTQIVKPVAASKDDLLVVHSNAYLKSLKKSANVSEIIKISSASLLPNYIVQQRILRPLRKQVGGTVLAGKLAKERGWAINVGGGFHHGSAEKGGGFCAYADITLCIRYAFQCLNITRAMIIDLDAHQGNGHATDFADDGRVYILDVYNKNIYPRDYEARKLINQKVELVSGTTTEKYLECLENALQAAERAFHPELVVYNAGTDILDGDPLGRLKVTPNGIIARDEKVFKFARRRSIPLVMLTSGGYMKSSARVIANSIKNLKAKNLIDLEMSESKGA